jgi:hypothetical protein
MNNTGVFDEAKLHVIAKTHQRRFHHRLHEVFSVSRDGPVLLRGNPLFELLALLAGMSGTLVQPTRQAAIRKETKRYTVMRSMSVRV